MLRASLIPAVLLVSLPALAQTGVYLPATAPSYGQDEYRSSDGTTCRTTMDGAKRVEVGAYGTGNKQDSNYGLPGYIQQQPQGNVGVYGRFSMSLDAPTNRMDCSKLYELDLEKRRLEVELMKRSLTSADRQLDSMKVAGPDRPKGDRRKGPQSKGPPV